MISVIIPTFNREKTIQKSINSVLNQTYKDVQVIIVDDGSSDNTKKVVESIDDNRIEYIFQENGGACSARNLGIAHAKGEYVSFQDSDDIWVPHKLDKYLEIIEKTGCDFICGTLMNDNGEKIFNSKKYAKSRFLTKKDSAHGYSTQTFFGKRIVFEQIKFDENVPRLQDFDFLTRVMSNYNVYFFEEPLVYYFLQDNSLSNNMNKYLMATDYFYKKYADDKRKKTIYKDISNFYLYLFYQRSNLCCPNPKKYLNFFLKCNFTFKSFLKYSYLLFLYILFK